MTAPMLRFLIAVLLVAPSMACAQSRSLFRDLGWLPPEPPTVAPAPRGGPRFNTIEQGFLNPGFETAASATQPSGWFIPAGRPLYAEGDAFEGTRYIRTNRGHFFSQRLDLTLPPWRTVSIGCMVRAEVGFELPTMNLFSARPPARQFMATTRDVGVGDVWVPFVGNFTHRNDDSLELHFRAETRQDNVWMDWDDLYVLLEDFGDGDFEADAGPAPRAAWSLLDGATMTTTETLSGARTLRLPPGARAERLAAHHADGVARYFITGTASGPLRITEHRLTAAFLDIDTPPVADAEPDAEGFFFAEWPSAPDDVRAARISIANNGAVPVLVDNVARGWAYAWPPTIQPVANSGAEEVRFAAYWPNLASAEFAVLDAEGNEVDRLLSLTLDRDTAWTMYDGGTLPEGDYTARLELANAAGERIAPERPFRIERPAPYPAAPAKASFDSFVRMPWYWFYPFTDEAEIPDADEAERRLQMAKDDGFNFLFVVIARHQFEIFREAIDRVGLPFVVYDPEFEPNLREDYGNRTWTPDLAMRDNARFDVLRESPWFRGIYIDDEPTPGEERQQVLDVMRRLERAGDPTSWSFLNPAFSVSDGPFPIVSTFDYPIERTPVLSADALIAYGEKTEDDLDGAIALGRDFWAGVQGYGMLSGRPVPSLAETRAQLGIALAIGSRGYFVFMYNSLNPFTGPRSHTYEERARLAAYREFNTRTTALEDLLLALPMARTAPKQSGPLFVRTADDGKGATYTFVVNAHPTSRIRADITTAALDVLLDVESGESTSGTLHSRTVAPGDWVILRSTIAPTAVHATVLDGEPRSTIDLPSRTIATGGSVGDVALSPEGGEVAALIDANVRIYGIGAEEPTLLLEEFGDFGTGKLRYLDDGGLFAGSRRWGARVYDRFDDAGFAYRLLHDRVIGSEDIAYESTDSALMVQNYVGVAALDLETTSTFHRRAQFFSENSDFANLAGPFADGSVIAIEEVFGAYRVVEADGGFAGERLMPTRLHGFADFNGTRLAIPHLDDGVTVLRLDAAGAIKSSFRIDDPALTNAERLAWLNDTDLAVIDTREGVRFYRVEGDAWRALGLWLPVAKPFVLSGIDASAGQIAVAIRAGQVVLAGTDRVTGIDREGGWILY